MKILRSPFAPVAALLLAATASTACFTSQTIVKLSPDGSGTIEQTNLVNGAMMGMAAGMAKSGGAQGADIPPVEDLFSEEQLRKQADDMGTGVRFVKSEPLTQGAMKGARATYAFDRIENVSVGGTTQMRSGSVTSTNRGPQLRFALAPQGANQRLTVMLPEPTEGKSTGADAAAAGPRTPAREIPPEAFAMVKSLFEGAKMTIEVEVPGQIVTTNAPVSNGARATLVEVDFGELLSDPSKLSALQSLKPGTDFATVRKTLEGVKGVKFPADQKVTIDFAR